MVDGEIEVRKRMNLSLPATIGWSTVGRGELPPGAQGPDRKSSPPAELRPMPTLITRRSMYLPESVRGQSVAIIATGAASTGR